MSLISHSLSKLKTSPQPEENSIVYKSQTLQIYTAALPDFCIGKIKLKKDVLEWSCPYSNQHGYISLLEIYRCMKEGTGLLIGEEAVEELEAIKSSSVEVSQLVRLQGDNDKSIYLLFEEIDVMSNWLNGLLSLINSIDCEVVESCSSESLAKKWIVEMSNQIQNEYIEVEISFMDEAGNFQSQIYCFDKELNCMSYMNLDKFNVKIVKQYLLHILREELHRTLSKDVVSIVRKNVVFGISRVNSINNSVRQWYAVLESDLKLEQINSHIENIQSGVKDPVIHCFRLLEIQKFSQQIQLASLFSKETPTGETLGGPDEINTKERPKNLCDCAIL